MNRSFLLTSALSLCWMLSPDGLVLLGNIAGSGGWYFLLSLGLALAVSGWALTLLTPLSLETSKECADTRPEQGAIKRIARLPELSLTLACWACLVLFIPTGTLVRAGFTFNETFVYWFPNFGFSFLLLGIVLLLHLWNQALPRKAQLLFFITPVCCLSVLCFSAFITGSAIEKPSIAAALATKSPDITFQGGITLFCTTLLLLLGYDQAGKPELKPPPRNRRLLILFSGTALVTLWGAASLLHVPQARLADSTIPYILGAREILGQPGRIIIGIAIISGSCGVLNGLLIMAGDSLQGFALSSSVSRIWKQRFYALLASLAIGMAMAKGLAGEEKLETYIFGSLLLWLLLTGLRTFLAGSNYPGQGRYGIHHFTLPLLYLAAAVILLISHQDVKTLCVFLALAITCSTAIAAIWLLLAGFGRKTSTT